MFDAQLLRELIGAQERGCIGNRARFQFRIEFLQIEREILDATYAKFDISVTNPCRDERRVAAGDFKYSWRAFVMNMLPAALIAVVLAFLTTLMLVQPAAHRALHWAAGKPFGLLRVAHLPAALEFTASFLLMDLIFYYWHLANHRVPFLWRFHNVHHSDPELDVSSAFRFHFGEMAFSALMNAMQVSIIGISRRVFFVSDGISSGSIVSPS